MQVENAIAFPAEHEETGLEIRVNFGVFAGRDATSAELDDLGKLLVPEAGATSIVAEERHEIGSESEASLNQVRVEVSEEQLPDDEHELDMLCGRLVEAAEVWANVCIAERHAEVSEL